MAGNSTSSESADAAAVRPPEPRLLRTKLFVPRLHPDLVPRDRLARRLDEGQSYRMTLVSAPAGFGKTTLLSDWLHRRGLQPAWVSLDPGDNDPRRFWAYVIAALDGLHSGLGQGALSLLQSLQPPPIEAILTDLTNDVAALLGSPAADSASSLILVLDDYHVIQAPAIHQGLEFFLFHLPPQMRLIVASRQDPPLPLALLRARRELLELRAPDLRFTLEEAAAFLNQCMGLSLAAQDLAALEARTEGWAAGLQLAALSMQGVDDTSGFIRAFAGSHRYVFDYLAQEVLDRQPQPIKEFLLHTSILDRLSGPLCDALLQPSNVPTSQSILEHIESANLFLVPLDQERHWYRYHYLFAEFLRRQLEQAAGEEGVAALERQASAWFERQGLIDDAVQHSLRAGDFDTATRLVDAAAEEMFVRSELVTLCAWLAALPPDLVEARPRLSMLYAWALVAIGRPEEAEHWVQAIESAVGANVDALSGPEAEHLAPRVRAALVELSILRSTLAMGQGDLGRVRGLLQQALPYLAAESEPYLFNNSRGLRPAALFTLAVVHELSGQIGQAGQAFAEAADLALDDANQHIYPMALTHLANLQVVQGQLHQAQKTCQQALETAAKMTSRASPLAGMAYVGLGRLLYEWNDLAAARRHLEQGIALARPWMNWEALVPGYLTLAYLRRAEGDMEGAATALDAFHQIEKMPLPPQAIAGLGAYRALLQAQWGDVEAAARWAEASGIDPDHDVPFFLEAEALIVARIWVAQGRPAQAQQLLARLLAPAQEAGRTGRLVEILALQAVVLHAQQQPDPALAALGQALVLAQPEGWVRTFVDLGAPMSDLLSRLDTHPVGQACRRQPVHNAYVNHLLAAFAPRRPESPPPTPPASEPSQPLVEPLTEREMEVLLLIAAGLSNQDIANRLTVSLNTVKTHLKNLYGKLGTGTRTQAVARARELGLL
jgi:LuxR family maltose regulon positive regulatory protein